MHVYLPITVPGLFFTHHHHTQTIWKDTDTIYQIWKHLLCNHGNLWVVFFVLKASVNCTNFLCGISHRFYTYSEEKQCFYTIFNLHSFFDIEIYIFNYQHTDSLLNPYAKKIYIYIYIYKTWLCIKITITVLRNLCRLHWNLNKNAKCCRRHSGTVDTCMHQQMKSCDSLM